MDASLVLTVVQTFLEVLDFFISRENQSVWGYKSQLGKLRDTISTIEAVLSNVEKHARLQLPCSIPPVTLDRLKEAVYEADDLFDEIATLAQRKKLSMPSNKVSQEVHLYFSRFNHFYYAFTKSREIKKIRERLDAIAKDHLEFGSMHVQAPTLEVGNHSRETHSFVCEEDVIIGRDGDKQRVIDMLLDDTVEEAVSVVSIVGIGGLGKTTLAQLVYNDVRIHQSAFQLKMWVCVSDSFDLQLLLCKILAEATNETNKSSLSMDQLQRNLRQKLEGKKYLLVLDDVWDEDQSKWHELRKLLSQGGRGSRIIVTTRSLAVANIAGSHSSDKTHELEGLSHEDSWDLFRRMTLEPGQHLLESQFLEIGQVCICKCVNVPLALKVIGSLLRGQGESYWRNLANTDLYNIVQERNNIVQERNHDLLHVLKISYNYLSPCLKSCFSFCAVFPKNHEIMKEDLIRLWMAQGFIRPSNGKSFEDVGEEYFTSLLQRCFFEEVTRNYESGMILSCKMHDLIYDLAKGVAGTEITTSSSYGINPCNDKTRHISIDNENVGSEMVERLAKMKRLRTLLVLSSINFYEHVPNMRYLRVLDLSQSSFGGERNMKKMLSMIGQLVHLRYLDLSHKEELFMLPSSITQLCNLQTLKLEGCWKLNELPMELSNLINLRILDIWGCQELRYMPPGMNRMTSLHKLPLFVLGGSKEGRCGVGDLEDLKYLVKLTDKIEIKMLEGWRYDAAKVKEGGYLINKPLLNEIIISWNDESIDDDNPKALLQGLQPHPNVKKLSLHMYPGVKFPSWGEGESLTMNLSKALPKLVELELENCIRLKHIPLLSQLRHMKVLSLRLLKELEYVESRDNNGSISSGDGLATTSGGRGTRQAHGDELVFFPSLEKLELRKLPELKGWWKAASHSDSEEANNNDGKLQLQQQQQESSSSIVAFPCLSLLDIQDCPNLTTFPLLPILQELRLKGSHKALRYYDSQHHWESFQHLSSLFICGDDEIERLSTREVFRSGRLSSLRSLQFKECRKLKRVLEGEVCLHFTALETLELRDLEELEMEKEEGGYEPDEDMAWRCLGISLRCLTLRGLPKMGKMPRGLLYLIALRSLEISHCSNLEEIPPWISCLTSLRHLEICDCPKVKSLPKEMSCLTSLYKLDLRGCSEELKERCQQESGVDWPFIRHIPNISLYYL